MRKLKLLVSAYACSPFQGSEPGMGWNFVKELSKYHEVHVIVEKRKWKKPINNFLKLNSNYNKNLKFYFIDKKRFPISICCSSLRMWMPHAYVLSA